MQANKSGDKTSAAAKEAHAKSQAKTSDLYSQAMMLPRTPTIRQLTPLVVLSKDYLTR